MEFFKIRKDIPFMKHALLFNVISFITFALAVFFLVTRGLNFSIEFTGGTVIETRYSQTANVENVRNAMVKAGVAEPQVQTFGSANDLLIRLGTKEAALPAFLEKDTATGKDILSREKITKSFLDAGGAGAKITRVEYIGPAVGNELAVDGAKALAFVVIGIMIYLAIRFEWKFAVAAIIANLHDVIIILGFFAFFQWEFSLAVLAATLAVLGYSVNESVVIFDRVREKFREREAKNMSVQAVLNHAITSTISRTIITHGSTQMMVLAMLLFGGPTLFYFALALTIGICFGIYSSVFVAAAVAMWLGVKREDLLVPVKKTEDDQPETP
jgi:preprotein translocase subunit SecF